MAGRGSGTQVPDSRERRSFRARDHGLAGISGERTAGAFQPSAL